MRTFYLFLIVLCITSCSKKVFNQEALQNQIRIPWNATENFRKVNPKDANVVLPYRLGVYFAKHTTFNSSDPFYYTNKLIEWKWDDFDKKIILKLVDDLKNNKIISGVAIINEAISDNNNIQEIRFVAENAGVDRVLIVNGIFDMDYYGNGLGFTYALIFTGFIVPGTNSHGLFMINTSLWDVHDPYRYFSVEAKGVSKQVRPKFLINQNKLLKQSKSNALSSIKNELSIYLNDPERK